MAATTATTTVAHAAAHTYAVDAATKKSDFKRISQAMENLFKDNPSIEENDRLRIWALLILSNGSVRSLNDELWTNTNSADSEKR